MRTINKIIIHCSASANTFDIGVKEITAWHKARGFKTVGYHYVIRRNGVIENGRDLEQVGAHCKGHNADSIGICLVGDDKFTREQFAALIGTLSALYKRYPNVKLYGHRDLDTQGKTCPNFAVSILHDLTTQPLTEILLRLKSQGCLTE